MRPRRRGGDFLRHRHRRIGLRGPQAELGQDLERRAGIDRKPRAHGGAGRVVDLVDQARRQLDELALLVGGMRARLHIEIGQHAQQRRPDVDALAAGERHQPVEARK